MIAAAPVLLLWSPSPSTALVAQLAQEGFLVHLLCGGSTLALHRHCAVKFKCVNSHKAESAVPVQAIGSADPHDNLGGGERLCHPYYRGGN